jgi:hypothetical protein
MGEERRRHEKNTILPVSPTVESTSSGRPLKIKREDVWRCRPETAEAPDELFGLPASA